VGASRVIACPGHHTRPGVILCYLGMVEQGREATREGIRLFCDTSDEKQIEEILPSMLHTRAALFSCVVDGFKYGIHTR